MAVFRCLVAPCLTVSATVLGLFAVPAAAQGRETAVEAPPVGLEELLSGRSDMEGAELDRAVRAAAAFPLGSADNPVRAEGPAGQQDYLSRLRCRDGSAPAFRRRVSGGRSPFGGIVDYYAVQCDGDPIAAVVMDMYHPGHREARALPGFTIRPAD